MKATGLAVATVALAACSDAGPETACNRDEADSDAFADCVDTQATIEDSDYNHAALPGIVLGPPGGTADVASLGCGGSITLWFGGVGIIDGDGPDLIVFENPFSDDFPEPGEISVSVDGTEWASFPCDGATLEGCAGVTPSPTGSDFDPTDPDAGGDSFDLADLGLDDVHYVRIDDVSEDYWQPLDQDFCDPGQDGKGGFDLDAVASVHG